MQQQCNSLKHATPHGNTLGNSTFLTFWDIPVPQHHGNNNRQHSLLLLKTMGKQTIFGTQWDNNNGDERDINGDERDNNGTTLRCFRPVSSKSDKTDRIIKLSLIHPGSKMTAIRSPKGDLQQGDGTQQRDTQQQVDSTQQRDTHKERRLCASLLPTKRGDSAHRCCLPEEERELCAECLPTLRKERELCAECLPVCTPGYVCFPLSLFVGEMPPSKPVCRRDASLACLPVCMSP